MKAAIEMLDAAALRACDVVNPYVPVVRRDEAEAIVRQAVTSAFDLATTAASMAVAAYCAGQGFGAAVRGEFRQVVEQAIQAARKI